MSADSWQHACCEVCYPKLAREHLWPPIPADRELDPKTDYPKSRPCCFCGLPTRGIRIQDDPATVHGQPKPETAA
jgi:hypothetical protein